MTSLATEEVSKSVVDDILEASFKEIQNLSQSSENKPNHQRDPEYDDKPRANHNLPFVYYPGFLLPDLFEDLNKTVEIRVESRYLTNLNEKVISREVWGSDVYSDDSDIVAMLKHSGLHPITDITPDHDLTVILRILPKLAFYESETRNGIKSRKWDDHDGLSTKIERCTSLKKGSATHGLKSFRKSPFSKEIHYVGPASREYCDHQSSDSIFLMRFNLTNEPCFKYSHVLLADKGFERTERTSFRFFREVLYVENDQDRYEISMKFLVNSMGYYTYKFGKVKSPLLRADQQMHPLPEPYVQLIYDKLDWQEFVWIPNAVLIRDQIISLTKFYWCSKSATSDMPVESSQTPLGPVLTV